MQGAVLCCAMCDWWAVMRAGSCAACSRAGAGGGSGVACWARARRCGGSRTSIFVHVDIESEWTTISVLW